MADPRHRLGLRAEAAVAAWLEGCGWRMLARRHRSRAGGEVDLIGLDPSGFIVAVEVRARTTPRPGAADETLDARRIGRLRRTLIDFAAGGRVQHRGPRVDLVAVEPATGSDGAWRLRRHPGVDGW